jgi:hypothetical protein
MMIDSDQIRDECKCMTPPFHYLDYEKESIGVDETNGRFGEVTIDVCKLCGTRWLHYFAEFPSFSESGRWYRGCLKSEMLASLTPETALEIMNDLPWHFYGGSYFRTTGARSIGPGSIQGL